MILGVNAHSPLLGWALLDDAACSFIDLGVVVTKPLEADRAVTLDRAARANAQAAVIAERARGCHTIVVERMPVDGPDGGALVPVALSWGVAIGVIATLDPRPRLLTIAPSRWQREVLPHAGEQVDYDELAHTAATYLLANHPRAAERLLAIKKQDRNHAIDAAMLALMGALQPAKCERIEAT